jgi:hypothetical protein
MSKNERKAENDSGKRNQRCKGILAVENEQAYEDNENECNSE